MFWLLLALEARFWALAGTILGTVVQRLITPLPWRFRGDMGTARPGDVLSLSEFKRRTSHLIDRFRKTGCPVVVTINGKDALVVQDAAGYQALLDRVEAIEPIREGLADLKAGGTKPARQVFTRLRRKHGVPD